MTIKQSAPIVLFIFALFLTTSVCSLAQGSDESLVQERCGVCHGLNKVCKKLGSLDNEKSLAMVTRMVTHGANLNADEQKVVAEYLAGLPAGAKPVCD